MASFRDLPVDVVELIAKSGCVEVWLSLCRVSRIFSRLSTGVHRSNILKALTVESVDTLGSKLWTVNGKLHREGDSPAYIYADGCKEWYVHGKRHREGDSPAYIGIGSKEWYVEGRQHREGDLPAVTDADGYKAWYVEGKQHREGDLPAIIYANGSKEWWNNGKRVK